MSNIDRFFNLMKRTGLPVVVSQDGEEPIVIMPLDAYEMLVVPADEPLSSPQPKSVVHNSDSRPSSPTSSAPQSAVQTPEMPETPDSKGFSLQSEFTSEVPSEATSATGSVEDRFFLDSID